MTSRPTSLTSPALLAAAIASVAGTAAHAQQYTATLFAEPVSFEVFVHGAGGGRQVGSALSETTMGGAHATLWMGPGSTPIDLHPAGRDGSTAYGCGGQQQVGVAYLEADTQAILWTGTAASAVVLNPPGFSFAAAYRTDGTTQVGAGRGPGTGRGPHALSWAGTAESVVDLHPDGYISSLAFDVEGSLIVGAAIDSFDFRNAGYWTARDAASWVPLHPEFGFDETSADAVGGGQIAGSGSGELTAGATHALLWTENGGTLTDLHPAGATASFVFAVRGGVQGGSIITDFDGSEHAAVWTGTAESMVDLHDLIPDGPWSTSRVTSVDSDGSLYGYAANGGFVQGVRWTPPATVCGPADVGGTGGVPGPDGRLDNNDFVVFIDMFFAQSAVADMGSTGGVPGPDGQWNNNDFVVFIDRFFAGC